MYGRFYMLYILCRKEGLRLKLICIGLRVEWNEILITISELTKILEELDHKALSGGNEENYMIVVGQGSWSRDQESSLGPPEYVRVLTTQPQHLVSHSD